MSTKPAARRLKTSVKAIGKLDMLSLDTLEKFRRASEAYTAKAVQSKAAALKTLQSEGILTKGGNLTKHYKAR